MNRSPAADHGSAAVEFVMVAALVVVVALGVLQLVLASHVRSTLTACASEGARVAAVARQGDDAGVARAVDCARASLGLTATGAAERVDAGGRPAVRVSLEAVPPALLPWSGPVAVSARALVEGAGP